VNVWNILLWGFVATVVLTTMMSAAQALGLTRMSMPFLLGTMATPNRDRAMLVGFLLHLMNGWLFALLYAAAFESLGLATWWLGGSGGLVHGLVALIVGMSMLPAVHPRMASERHGPTPTRALQPPGFMALHYGRRTPLVALAAHAVYGVIIGTGYSPAL
jgi:hypothetical protein